MGEHAGEVNHQQQWTVRELRRRWKPAKERLSKSGQAEGLRIRLHRCCSWLQRVEQLSADATVSGAAAAADREFDDAALVCRWIALNALYARWDDNGRAPFADVESLKSFTSHIVRVDRDGRISEALSTHKRLVIALLEDALLSRSFWQEPTVRRAGKSSRAAWDARDW